MYVDAMYVPGEGIVRVAERVNGQRVIRDHPAIYEFYVRDPQGTHRGLHGESLKLVRASNEKEFKRLKQIHSHRETYESDLKPVNRVLEEHYLHQDAPRAHLAVFDIETVFDRERGYSQPEDAENPISSIAVHLQWLNQTVCLAVPPSELPGQETELTWEGAQEIADRVGNCLLYRSEREMLDAFLFLIDDADILTGWNSEGYDIPYVVNRIIKIMGRAESRRLCLWGQMPRKRTFSRGGKDQETYDLTGRIHLDYLQLYKKYSYEERHSYSLDAIAEAELGERKVEYEGNLDQLYREDFELFLRYNIKDTELVNRLDLKLQYVDLVSGIAHGSTVLIPASMGAVAVTEQSIINEAHSQGLRVPDRERRPGSWAGDDGDDLNLEEKAAGGWVQNPKRGLHRWIGSIDLNSLYPSVIRALNMSPETLVGQIRTHETDHAIMDFVNEAKRHSVTEWWNDRFNTLEMQPFLDNDNSDRIIVDFADGTEVVTTGAELRQLVFAPENSWCITANGTIFRTDIKGVIPGLLERWYAERKIMQKIKNQYSSLAEGVALKDLPGEWKEWRARLEAHESTPANPYDLDQTFSVEDLQEAASHKNTDTLFRYMSLHELTFTEDGGVTHQDSHRLADVVSFWDKRQLVKKINLNSAYGGLLNAGCRFFDKRIGQSTTLTGRSIARHMTAKANEFLDGVYDHEGRGVIYGDTDSVYFSAYPVLRDEIERGEVEWTRESVIELYDTISQQVSDTFPDFMLETFNVPRKQGSVIRCGREVVGLSGLFTTKKRYAILVYDEEGYRKDVDGKPGKLKITGMDIRRSDTPRFVQDFLRDVLLRTLVDIDEDAVIDMIREFKTQFRAMKPWEKGSPKGVNNLTSYGAALDKFMRDQSRKKTATRPTIPGHVMASINWNNLRVRHNDHHSMPILDGQKIIVCSLMPRNDLGMNSIAYPVDEPHLPDWFLDLPFDEEQMERTILDGKIKNLLGVLNWDLDRADPNVAHMETLFEF